SLMLPPPPSPTLLPYTTLFRSSLAGTRPGACWQRRWACSCRTHCTSPLRSVARSIVGVVTKGLHEALIVDAVRSPIGKKNGTLRSEEHTSELQSRGHLVCRLLL